ncbi:MAG TPA: hypothetical protein VLS25_11915, partial [Dehalococcoidia bacterium]|nr:hypothetical protein [Dehalococcoidia bacterium]
MVTENRDETDTQGSPIDRETLTAFLQKHDNRDASTVEAKPHTAIPNAPATLQETGLSTSFLQELMLKVFHYVETPTAEHLARVMCLSNKIVNDLLDALKSD